MVDYLHLLIAALTTGYFSNNYDKLDFSKKSIPSLKTSFVPKTHSLDGKNWKNDEAVDLDAISISFNTLSQTWYWNNYTRMFLVVNTVHCAEVFCSDENRRCTCLRWKNFGWNDRRNPWIGPPIQMEMNPPRCAWCTEQWGMGIRGYYEGCLPYHPVFTRREGLILYAADWRAQELTEQIDNPALYSWASIYPKTIDQEVLLKDNDSYGHAKILFNGKKEKAFDEVLFLNDEVMKTS